jgi:hypothetical protein
VAYKHDERRADLEITADGYIYQNESVKIILGKDYAAQNVVFKGDSQTAVSLRHAAEMAILCQAARRVLPFSLGKDLQ